jgi:hypothetical protein
MIAVKTRKASEWFTIRTAKLYADNYLSIYRVARAYGQGKDTEGNLWLFV